MYKVTIVKISLVEVVTSEYEKVADTGNKKDNGPVYEYVSKPITKPTETEIYAQMVDDLDLPTVIKAVNVIL